MRSCSFNITKDLMPNMHMTVKLKGKTAFRIRLFIAKQLIELAGWILHCPIHIETDSPG